MAQFTKKTEIETISLDMVPYSPTVWSEVTAVLRLKWAQAHPEILTELMRAHTPLDQAIQHVLRLETAYTRRHKIDMNMTMAKFPSMAATLESFDFSLGNVDESQVRYLFETERDWIDQAANVLLYGGPGLGKTHIAIALGKKAIAEQGYSVRFISANDLLARLDKANNAQRLDDELRLLNRNNLIIVDEFGYPLMKDHPAYAPLFYAFITSRYERRSIIITTNRSISEWATYLGNDVKCSEACIDRFLHHSFRIRFTGKSYRLAAIRNERVSSDVDKQEIAKAVGEI